MSEFRTNPFTGEMTLYAENRKNRPYEFVHNTKAKNTNNENCPFCGGHETWTTDAVYQDGPDGAWQMRVFPNMFPAVKEDCGELEGEAFYEQTAGRGRHEVLVDTPNHNETIDAFSVEHIEKVLHVLQDRLNHFRTREHTQYVQIFKNCGPSAGMSIRHSHWQLMGLPVVPRRAAAMAEKMQGEDCLFCKMLTYEKGQGKRIAGETEHFIAIAPYAGRFPYEVWLAPKLHQRDFGDMDDAQRKDLAKLLWETLQKITKLKEDIGYNICVMDGPRNRDFHWHIEILPRIGGFAGFEYATDCFINMVSPERAAAYYRGENIED